MSWTLINGLQAASLKVLNCEYVWKLFFKNLFQDGYANLCNIMQWYWETWHVVLDNGRLHVYMSIWSIDIYTDIHVTCVCVTRLKRRTTSIGCHFMFSFYRNHARGMRPSCKRMPTKLCMMVEARADHPGVPATYLFPRWDEAEPKNLHAVFFGFIPRCFMLDYLYGFRNLISRLYHQIWAFRTTWWTLFGTTSWGLL